MLPLQPAGPSSHALLTGRQEARRRMKASRSGFALSVSLRVITFAIYLSVYPTKTQFSV